MENKEPAAGAVIFVAVVILGELFLKSLILFRLLIGIGFGYSLMRAYTGFAGSVNRAYRTGSTKLLRALMLMMFITCLLMVALLLNGDPASYSLSVHPINFGLLLGGIMFGFGMALSSCCASGVLQDLSLGFSRATTTLVFFCVGVYVGFPAQHSASWILKSWINTPTGKKFSGGVFLPDLFPWDGLHGYLGAMLLTILFCAIVAALSLYYERKRKLNKTYTGCDTEIMQEQTDSFDSTNYKLFSRQTYNRIFVKPWTLAQGAVAVSIFFILLISVTKKGWGVSTTYGIWFGKILMIFGVPADAVAAFAKSKPDAYLQPFFLNAESVQNFGIILGTIIYLLAAGVFLPNFKEGFHMSLIEAVVYAAGGFSMGLGTRFANGCNVGAFYTPISSFSLSGWIFLIFLIIGGILGNFVGKKVLTRS
jgi:uncharacterized protein